MNECVDLDPSLRAKSSSPFCGLPWPYSTLLPDLSAESHEFHSLLGLSLQAPQELETPKGVQTRNSKDQLQLTSTRKSKMTVLGRTLGNPLATRGGRRAFLEAQNLQVAL